MRVCWLGSYQPVRRNLYIHMYIHMHDFLVCPATRKWERLPGNVILLCRTSKTQGLRQAYGRLMADKWEHEEEPGHPLSGSGFHRNL